MGRHIQNGTVMSETQEHELFQQEAEEYPLTQAVSEAGENEQLSENEDDTQVLSYTFVCLTACGLGFCWTNMNNLVWSCE